VKKSVTIDPSLFFRPNQLKRNPFSIPASLSQFVQRYAASYSQTSFVEVLSHMSLPLKTRFRANLSSPLRCSKRWPTVL
jgi:hypothetical protein